MFPWVSGAHRRSQTTHSGPMTVLNPSGQLAQGPAHARPSICSFCSVPSLSLFFSNSSRSYEPKKTKSSEEDQQVTGIRYAERKSWQRIHLKEVLPPLALEIGNRNTPEHSDCIQPGAFLVLGKFWSSLSPAGKNRNQIIPPFGKVCCDPGVHSRWGEGGETDHK